VVGAHLEGRLDDDPASGYNQLIDHLLPHRPHFPNYQRYPLVRAIRTFMETPRSCLFPTSRIAAENLSGQPADAFLESEPIDKVSAHLFARAPELAPGTFNDILGKTIAVQRGAITNRVLEHFREGRIIQSPNDRAALKMLQAGRVDFTYSWNPDALIISEKNGLSLPHFNPQFVFFDTTTHLVCKKFDGANELLDIVSGRIREAKKSGKLRQMLGRFARIVNE